MSYLSYATTVFNSPTTGIFRGYYPPGTRVGDSLFLHISGYGGPWDFNNPWLLDSTWTLVSRSSIFQDQVMIFYSVASSNADLTGYTVIEKSTGSTLFVARASMFRFDDLVTSTTALISDNFLFSSSSVTAAQSTTGIVRNSMHINFIFRRGADPVLEYTGEAGGDWRCNVAYATESPNVGLQTAFLFSTGGIVGGTYNTPNTYTSLNNTISWELDLIGKYGKQAGINYRRGRNRTRSFGRV